MGIPFAIWTHMAHAQSDTLSISIKWMGLISTLCPAIDTHIRSKGYKVG